MVRRTGPTAFPPNHAGEDPTRNEIRYRAEVDRALNVLNLNDEQLDQRLGSLVETDITDLDRMRWRGQYVAGAEYAFNDVSRDGAYTGVVINPDGTTDHVAPIDQGPPTPLYTGADPTANITAKTLNFGMRYTFPVAARVVNYRIYVVSGYTYSSYYHLNDDVFVSMLTWIATSTGWTTFSSADLIIPAGTVMELAVHVDEPALVPDVTTLSYDYDSPKKETDPDPGEIIHAEQETQVLRISKTGQGGQNNTATLGALTAGDTIEGAGIRWLIVRIEDKGSWIAFEVAPAALGAPEGVQDFDFGTVVAQPITIMRDVNYFQSDDRVRGLLAIDGGAVVESDDAFGVDITYQQVLLSDDWDYLAVFAGGDTTTALSSLLVAKGVLTQAEVDGLLLPP